MSVSAPPSPEALTARAIEILATLVAFDTTSRNSNLALIDWVEAYLEKLGVSAQRLPNPDGTRPISWRHWGRKARAASSCRAIPMWCRSTARPGRAIPGP